MGDISNLTAEIETFVRAHDNDQEQLRESPVKSPLKKKDKSPPIPPARTTSHATTVINQTSDDDAVAYSQTTVTIEQVPIQTVTSDVRNHSVEVHQHVETKIAEREKIPSNETMREDTEHGKLIDRKSRESPENNEDYPERTSHTPDIGKIRKFNSEKQLNVNNNVEVEPPHVEVEVAVHSPPRIIVRKPTEDWEYDEEIQLNDDANHANGEESPKTPISSEVEFILEHDISARASPSTYTSTQKRISEAIVVETVRVATSSLNDAKEKPKISTKKNFKNSLEESSAKNHEFILKPTPEVDVPELKIVESTDDLTNAPATVSQSSDKYKIRFVALKNFSPEPLRRDVELRPHNKQEFDVEDIDLPPAPPQRRRSVKDIIASINKSQSLLKMNQQPNGNVEAKRSYNYETYLPQTIPTAIMEPSSQSQQLKSSNESIIRKYNELEESERKIRKMITDMEQSSIDVPVPVVEKFDEFMVDGGDKSDDLFKKCVVRREKSLQSGASQEESRSSMEWNPLPKPRRSRNLTHELENGKI